MDAQSVLMFIISVLSAYIIGSFPTSFIMTKFLKGIDIRHAGSKNVGATNVFRVVGRVPALITLVVDVLKGVLVVTLITNFFYQFLENLDYEFFRTLLGFSAICGHIWPIFLGFKGGKGIATTLGIMAIITPKLFLLSIAIWLFVFLPTNYVSLASIVMAISFPILASLLNQSLWIIIFAVTICAITCYKHRDNIKRLIIGEENKTNIFKK